jgi:hypothetical protein
LHSRNALNEDSQNSEVFKIAKSETSEEAGEGVDQTIHLVQGSRQGSEDSLDKGELVYRINSRNKKLMGLQIMWIFMIGVSFVLMVLQAVMYFKGPFGSG